jgi:hypothetical protein
VGGLVVEPPQLTLAYGDAFIARPDPRACDCFQHEVMAVAEQEVVTVTHALIRPKDVTPQHL